MKGTSLQSEETVFGLKKQRFFPIFFNQIFSFSNFFELVQNFFKEKEERRKVLQKEINTIIDKFSTEESRNESKEESRNENKNDLLKKKIYKTISKTPYKLLDEKIKKIINKILDKEFFEIMSNFSKEKEDDEDTYNDLTFLFLINKDHLSFILMNNFEKIFFKSMLKIEVIFKHLEKIDKETKELNKGIFLIFSLFLINLFKINELEYNNFCKILGEEYIYFAKMLLKILGEEEEEMNEKYYHIISFLEERETSKIKKLFRFFKNEKPDEKKDIYKSLLVFFEKRTEILEKFKEYRETNFPFLGLSIMNFEFKNYQQKLKFLAEFPIKKENTFHFFSVLLIEKTFCFYDIEKETKSLNVKNSFYDICQLGSTQISKENFLTELYNFNIKEHSFSLNTRYESFFIFVFDLFFAFFFYYYYQLFPRKNNFNYEYSVIEKYIKTFFEDEKITENILSYIIRNLNNNLRV